MDFNAGTLIDGDSLEEMEQELFEAIIAVAEGRRAASNERAGFYQIALLRDGVTL
jgi:altronate hydrolase